MEDDEKTETTIPPLQAVVPTPPRRVMVRYCAHCSERREGPTCTDCGVPTHEAAYIPEREMIARLEPIAHALMAVRNELRLTFPWL